MECDKMYKFVQYPTTRPGHPVALDWKSGRLDHASPGVAFRGQRRGERLKGMRTSVKRHAPLGSQIPFSGARLSPLLHQPTISFGSSHQIVEVIRSWTCNTRFVPLSPPTQHACQASWLGIKIARLSNQRLAACHIRSCSPGDPSGRP